MANDEADPPNPPLNAAEQAAFDRINSGLGTAQYFGEGFLVMTINIRATARDADLTHLEPLADKLDWLHLGGSKVTSKGLRTIGKLHRLKTLLLHDTAVDDEGLQHLTGLRNLTYLRLDGTKVEGPGLVHLKDLPSLETLVLKGLPIGIEHIEVLRDMPKLREVGYEETRITRMQMACFVAELPVTHNLVEDLKKLRREHPEIWRELRTTAPMHYLRLQAAIAEVEKGSE